MPPPYIPIISEIAEAINDALDRDDDGGDRDSSGDGDCDGGGDCDGADGE